MPVRVRVSVSNFNINSVVATSTAEVLYYLVLVISSIWFSTLSTRVLVYFKLPVATEVLKIPAESIVKLVSDLGISCDSNFS
jgi:hypothetical protein